MPQELHVLQCAYCNTYQVQIVKKAPKWACSMCNEKQSVVKVFAKGTGKECREFVQKLNENRIKLEKTPREIRSSQQQVTESPPHSEPAPSTNSKWSKYTVE